MNSKQRLSMMCGVTAAMIFTIASTQAVFKNQTAPLSSFHETDLTSAENSAQLIRRGIRGIKSNATAANEGYADKIQLADYQDTNPSTYIRRGLRGIKRVDSSDHSINVVWSDFNKNSGQEDNRGVGLTRRGTRS